MYRRYESKPAQNAQIKRTPPDNTASGRRREESGNRRGQAAQNQTAASVMNKPNPSNNMPPPKAQQPENESARTSQNSGHRQQNSGHRQNHSGTSRYDSRNTKQPGGGERGGSFHKDTEPSCEANKKNAKNLLMKFIPESLYNPKTGKVLGIISAEDLMLAALILLILDNSDDCGEDNSMLVYALLYILISDHVDLPF